MPPPKERRPREGLIKESWWLNVVHNPWIWPYFLGGVVLGGGALDSHEYAFSWFGAAFLLGFQDIRDRFPDIWLIISCIAEKGDDQSGRCKDPMARMYPKNIWVRKIFRIPPLNPLNPFLIPHPIYPIQGLFQPFPPKNAIKTKLWESMDTPSSLELQDITHHPENPKFPPPGCPKPRPCRWFPCHCPLYVAPFMAMLAKITTEKSRSKPTRLPLLLFGGVDPNFNLFLHTFAAKIMIVAFISVPLLQILN